MKKCGGRLNAVGQTRRSGDKTGNGSGLTHGTGDVRRVLTPPAPAPHPTPGSSSLLRAAAPLAATQSGCFMQTSPKLVSCHQISSLLSPTSHNDIAKDKATARAGSCVHSLQQPHSRHVPAAGLCRAPAVSPSSEAVVRPDLFFRVRQCPTHCAALQEACGAWPAGSVPQQSGQPRVAAEQLTCGS